MPSLLCRCMHQRVERASILYGTKLSTLLPSVFGFGQVLEEMEQEKVPYDEMTHTIIVDSMIVKRHVKEAITYALQLKQDKIRSAHRARCSVADQDPLLFCLAAFSAISSRTRSARCSLVISDGSSRPSVWQPNQPSPAEARA